jgi:hypothetical protein
VSIVVGLQDAEGRTVTRVDVEANGDRFAGDPPWWADWGDCNRTGGCVRVVRKEAQAAVSPA